MSDYSFKGSNKYIGSPVIFSSEQRYLFHEDEHKIPLYQFLFFLCMSVTAHQTRVAVGELGESLQECTGGRSKWGGGEEAGDLAWPVGGLIPVLALELLSSAMAQIFRFGLGCHVGSKIL